MEQTLKPARISLPGRVLSRELEARGWTQRDLAKIMGRPPQVISEIVRGHKQITPDTAIELGEALGTSAELWIGMETNYRLHVARQRKNTSEIRRRSQVMSLEIHP